MIKKYSYKEQDITLDVVMKIEKIVRIVCQKMITCVCYRFAGKKPKTVIGLSDIHFDWSFFLLKIVIAAL